MDPRSLTKDFRESLQCLNARGVEYLVIGGHAVAFYGYPRATADLDLSRYPISRPTRRPADATRILPIWTVSLERARSGAGC
jgi:hypothetical protein